MLDRRGPDLVPILLACVLAVGCIPPRFSPPARTDISGASGRLAPDQGDFHYSAPSYALLNERFTTYGHGGFDIPLGADHHLETGATVGVQWVLGHLGVRRTVWRRPQDRLGRVFGLSGGGGIGGGGENWEPSSDEDRWWDRIGPPWHQRVAAGGYLGVGMAHHVHNELALYQRARIQATVAYLAPPTVWWQYSLGIDMYPHRWGVAFNLGIGCQGFANDHDVYVWPTLDFGLSLAIPWRTWDSR